MSASPLIWVNGLLRKNNTDLALGSNKITGVGAPAAADDVAIRSTAPWLLIATHEVVGSAEQDFTISGLNGDTDRIYFGILDYFPPPSLTNFDIYPNGSALGAGTGVTQRLLSSNGDVKTGSETQDVLRFARGASRGVAEFRLAVKTGANRVMSSVVGEGGGTADADAATDQWAGVWRQTSTNITSLKFRADVASGFAIGSKLWLYKING